MTEKHMVVVSRKWHHPSITVDVVPTDGVTATMSLDDFVTALAQAMAVEADPPAPGVRTDTIAAALAEEIGSPAFILTKAALLEKLASATAAVLGKTLETPTAGPTRAALLDQMVAASAVVVREMKAAVPHAL